MVDAGLPGAFLWVEEPDGRLAFFTAGVADLSTGRPMGPQDRYRVGSTTKTFTAVVVLQLVGEGRLALDDLVASRLPGRQVPNADVLTVEHLLRMRSGLFDFEDDPSLLGDVDAHLVPHGLDEVLDLGLRGSPAFRPGERFAYCNTNFCVLEAIVERITGRTLAEELADRVIGPLGLEHTSYPAQTDLSLPEPYIRGYDDAGAGWRDCSHAFFGRGDGALISTAGDLARFFRALLDRRLLPPELLTQMRTILPDDPEPRFAYGLGLIADPLPSGTVWGHSGGGLGYHHLPFLDPASGRFAVCIAQRHRRLPHRPHHPRPAHLHTGTAHRRLHGPLARLRPEGPPAPPAPVI